MVQFRQDIKDWEPYKIDCMPLHDLGNNENRLIDWSGLLKNLSANMELADLTYYGDNYYREVIEKYASYIGVAPQQVTVGVGSDFLIHMIVTTFLKPQDVFLTIDPDFFMYQVYNELHSSRFEAYPLEWQDGSLYLSADKIVDYARKVGASVIMLSNPNNPSSVAFKQEELETLLNQFDGLVVLDEAYIEFSTQPSFVALTQTYHHLIVLRTLSKAFGLAGLRLGFAVGCERLIYELDKAIPPFSLSNIVAKIGAAALDEIAKVEEVTGNIIAIRQDFQDFLTSIPNCHCLPSQTNFVTFTFPKAEEFYHQALKQGISFKYYPTGLLAGYLRVAIGTTEEMALLKDLIQTLSAS